MLFLCVHVGEFGSERLVQQIVASIMHATERRENIEQVAGHHPTTPDDEKSNPFDREQGEPLSRCCGRVSWTGREGGEEGLKLGD